jgi:competence protein ComGC
MSNNHISACDCRAEARVKTRRWSAQGLTVIDALIALLLIGILIGVVIPKYRQVAREAQESAIKAELVNIRSSINLFKMLNSRYPRSLNELIEKKVMLPGRIGSEPYNDPLFLKKTYLIPHAIDEKGNVLDPFGNTFVYDPIGGEVKSSTKGYETW